MAVPSTQSTSSASPATGFRPWAASLSPAGSQRSMNPDPGVTAAPPFEFPLPEGVLISSMEVPQVHSTRETDPTEHLITHLAIGLEPASANRPAHLMLREVGEDRLDRAGKPINRQADSAAEAPPPAVSDSSPAWLWAGLPLIALGGITFLALRKRGTRQR